MPLPNDGFLVFAVMVSLPQYGSWSAHTTRSLASDAHGIQAPIGLRFPDPVSGKPRKTPGFLTKIKPEILAPIARIRD